MFEKILKCNGSFFVAITELLVKRIRMTPGKWRFHWKMDGSSIKIFTSPCKEVTDYTFKTS